ncbi:MAG: glycosyltransferase family 2 protein [Bacillota bacterium]
MPQAAVTAVTVNYNAGPLLRGLVASLLAEPGIARVVVVDNASRDGSLEFPEIADPRVSVIRNAANRGFGAACNQGASRAETPYLLFINPDCRLPPGALARLAAVLDGRPDAAMLGPLVLNVDGSEQRGCRRHLPDPRRALMRVLKLGGPDAKGRVAGYDLTGTPLPKGPEPVEAISGSCMLIRRGIFERLGGWDEGYFLHCEDLDLCMRLKRDGQLTLFVPDVAVTHVQGVSSRGRPLFVLWHKHRGMWRYFGKFQRASSPAWLTALVALGISARLVLLAPGALLSRLRSAP